MSWCILIPVIVGVICAILGYLLRKISEGESNNDEYNDRIARLEAELDACKTSKTSLVSSLESELATTKTSLASALVAAKAPKVDAPVVAALIPFDAGAAKLIFGKKIKQDDLTVVEGIGPKIKELFHNHDVNTWKALSECSVDKCQDVLNSGGDRYKIHKPGTWPKQAKMAYEGKWKELLEWQDVLDGGKL